MIIKNILNQETGTNEVVKTKLSMPLLSFVNIPSFYIVEAFITFDMEVKEVTASKETTDAKKETDNSTSFSLFGIKESLTIKGNISSFKESSRNTDTSSKYHIEVRTKSKPIAEGLSKVIDILNSIIVPANR